MKYSWVPFAAIGVLLLVPLLSPRSTLNQTASTTVNPSAKYFWLAVYTYSLPPSAFTEGNHTYQYDFTYSAPKPGSLAGALHTVKVSSQAQVFPGSVLLRPGGLQAYDKSTDVPTCKVIRQISPNQEVKFMVAWVPDVQMTRDEFNRQVASLTATARWDGGQPVKMSHQLTTVSWEPLWNCVPWVDLLHQGRKQQR